jgi:hypothetical protein
MAINNFIPEVWSAKIFSDFDRASVFAGLVSREYEGEIRNFGDTVHINSIGPITVANYTKNSTSNITLQDLAGFQQDLRVDYAKYFAFQVDDVDQAQANPKVMGEAMRKAAVALAQQIDTDLSGLYADAGATITSTACGPTAITEVIGKFARRLDENDAPRAGRALVVPPWFVQNLVQAQILKWIGIPTGNEQLMMQQGAGFVGNALGFDIIMSNNLVETTASGSSARQQYIMAFVPEAINFAMQVTKTEAYRPEGKFADAVKGMALYGMKVTQPKGLVSGTLTESTV